MNKSSKEKRLNSEKSGEFELMFPADKLSGRDFLDEDGHYWFVYDEASKDDVLAYCPGKTYHYEFVLNKRTLKCDRCGLPLRNPVWLGREPQLSVKMKVIK